MYLMVIHVPIYVDGATTLLATDWKRALELLRDSFGGRFGPLVVVAPSLPRSEGAADQVLEPCSERTDGIRLVPSIDARCRARHYWRRERRRWLADVRAAADVATVAHCHIDDLARPISGLGMWACVRRGLPTVFVEDTDMVLQTRELSRSAGALTRARIHARMLAYEQVMRWGVRHADLSLLKGRTLMQRYARYSSNARCFHNSSHRADEVVPRAALERRLAGLRTRPAVRLVYCGRLVDRKGVRESVDLVARANASAGTTVCRLDIIGDGPSAPSIRDMIRDRGLGDHAGTPATVRMLGSMPYGSELLTRLAGYDGMLFTPAAEDTPRMVFDGYAAALPLLAFDIDYIKERSDEEGAALLLDRRNPDLAAKQLVDLCRDRGRLAELSRAAREAGEYHTSDRWYQRRAEWTIDMVERVRATRGLPRACAPPAPAARSGGLERLGQTLIHK